MPKGMLLLKSLSHLMPTNSGKMLMKSEKIQEGSAEITEGLENMCLEKEIKGFILFSLFKSMLAREMFTFSTWGTEI